MALRNERVVWRLAPKDESDESSDDDGTDLEGLGSEDADVVGMKRGSRTRRRGGKRRVSHWAANRWCWMVCDLARLQHAQWVICGT